MNVDFNSDAFILPSVLQKILFSGDLTTEPVFKMLMVVMRTIINCQNITNDVVASRFCHSCYP